jgi:hypothetical protein
MGATWIIVSLYLVTFNELSRHAQIKLDVRRREPARWLAVMTTQKDGTLQTPPTSR